NFLLYCFMGGLNYVIGPLIGTVTLRIGWDQLSPTGEFQLTIYALLLILLMFALPNGLMSLYQEVKKWLGVAPVGHKGLSPAPNSAKPARKTSKGRK
ncbi:MAG: branched-chain amino acid ABC transporter permease, partial [Alphaproteobacteria bacterium]|nr:branched-chain amino acid ABC transporter permease [Alphaproteobacteria bacterium]